MTNFELDGAPYFHVIVVPDKEPAYITKFTRLADMLSFLRNLYGEKVQVFAFEGVFWPISKGPFNRYIIEPSGDGTLHPLFSDNKDDLKIDFHGFLDSTVLEKDIHDED